LLQHIVEKSDIVTLDILHVATHAGETLAETEIVGWVGFGWLSFGPIPVAAVLDIDHEDRMVANDLAA
jgi:hypothetical protein